MKTFSNILLVVALFMTAPIFGQTVNTWENLNDFSGPGHRYGVSFIVNEVAYVGTGTNTSVTEALKDLWRYNASTDSWTQMADVGGIGRWSAVGFAINSKGYVGTGLVGSPGSGFSVNDFWEYEPGTNVWTIKQNVGLTGRCGAVAFTIGGKGYVTTGYRSSETYDNTTYEYDPTTNTWTQRSDFPANEREDAGSFVIGNDGYVIGGVRYSTNPNLFVTLRDTYAFNPSSNTWTYKVTLR